MNLGQLYPNRNRWVLVLSRQVSNEGKPEPGRLIVLFLDLAEINKTLFTDMKIGSKGFLTFAGLLPNDRMVLPDIIALTDAEREFVTDAAAWRRPRDIPQAQEAVTRHLQEIKRHVVLVLKEVIEQNSSIEF